MPTPYKDVGEAVVTSFALRVFLPFAFGYFLSYLFRIVNVVIAPDLVADLQLDAAQLGWISSAYFLTFAIAQIPLGVLLDRYDVRHISCLLLFIAAAGATTFAMATAPWQLWLGRALIGLGVAACLMSAFRAYVHWLDAERLPLINGLQLASGGMGALVATAPVEWLLQSWDWRQLFLLLTGMTLLAIVLVWLLVPAHRPQASGQSWRQQWQGSMQILTNPFFWRLAPASVVAQSLFVSLQSLWAGQWLRDVAGYSREQAADLLMLTAAAMVAGFIGLGWLAVRLQRLGVRTEQVSIAGMAIFVTTLVLIVVEVALPAWLLWSLLGFFGTSGGLMYASLSQAFPKHLAGRVNTNLNLLLFIAAFLTQWWMGLVLNLWQPDNAGHYPVEAFYLAFGLGITLLAVSLAWFVLSRAKPQSAHC